jgi:hypothetical protein
MGDDGWLSWLVGACLLGAAMGVGPSHRPPAVAVEWPVVRERLERAWLASNVCGADPTVCTERWVAGP